MRATTRLVIVSFINFRYENTNEKHARNTYKFNPKTNIYSQAFLIKKWMTAKTNTLVTASNKKQLTALY